MRKRERLERAIAGEAIDRVPVALWRHLPGDDQRAADLARSTVDFQNAYDWDFLRVMPAHTYLTIDYGIQDAWLGDDRGLREITRHVISRSLDWTQLRPLSPDRGAFAKLIECLSLICKEFAGQELPIILTIYSPLVQPTQIAGKTQFLKDLRTSPDRVRSGLNILSESCMRLLDALRHLPEIAGIFLVTHYASHDQLSEQEYREHGMMHLTNILEAIPAHWWLNMIQVQGQSPMLRLIGAAPAQVIIWDTRSGASDIARGKNLVNGAVGGGLNDWHDLHQGTPALLASTIRDAVHQSEARRFILTGSGDGYVTTPQSNFRAVRNIVNSLTI